MNAVTEVMDELRKALAELEDCRARNADLRTMLEQVTRERDEARSPCLDCAMWAERSARWHDDMQRAERERDEARADLARSVAAWESAGMQGRTAHDAMLALAKERDEAFRRGAEAMREAAMGAAWHSSAMALHKKIKDLPIPEEP